MKQFLRLFGALALVLAFSASAPAVDVRVSGSWDFAFQHGDFVDLDDSRGEFWARQRLRTYMEFLVSDTLKGTLGFEIGEANWGNVGESTEAGQGFSIATDGVNIEVSHAYIDWLVPNTGLKVRMGLQGIALPGAVAGSPVLDENMAGILLSYAFTDSFDATLFWTRLYDDTMGDGFYSGGTATERDNLDAFGLLLPVSLGGVSVTPYGMYMHGGSNVSYGSGIPLGEKSDALWLGAAVEITALDPFVIKFDGIYGKSSSGDPDMNSDGFFLAAAVDYKMDRFTPGIFAFYGSGADEDGKGWMPVIAPCGFGPTSFGTDGAFGINEALFLTCTGTGLWAVGAQLADISFIDELSHVLRFAYYQGTNDRDCVFSATATGRMPYLRDNESAWEINLDSVWNIYGDNLIAALQIAYLGLDMEDAQYDYTNGAWRVAVALQYNF